VHCSSLNDKKTQTAVKQVSIDKTPTYLLTYLLKLMSFVSVILMVEIINALRRVNPRRCRSVIGVPVLSTSGQRPIRRRLSYCAGAAWNRKLISVSRQFYDFVSAEGLSPSEMLWYQQRTALIPAPEETAWQVGGVMLILNAHYNTELTYGCADLRLSQGSKFKKHKNI